jgi:hypothetical protein
MIYDGDKDDLYSKPVYGDCIWAIEYGTFFNFSEFLLTPKR